MRERLSSAVLNAVVAKWCLYCSNPLKKVIAKTRGRYQKFMATKGAAISRVCALNPTAIALVKSSGTRFTSRVIKSMILRKTRKIFALKTALCVVLANAGIKTCVKAPSAKIRRNRFGSLKAMKNISLYMFAPSADAVKRSLKNPKIRDIKIPKLLVKIALNMGFFRYIVYVLRNFNKCLVKI